MISFAESILEVTSGEEVVYLTIPQRRALSDFIKYIRASSAVPDDELTYSEIVTAMKLRAKDDYGIELVDDATNSGISGYRVCDYAKVSIVVLQFPNFSVPPMAAEDDTPKFVKF